MHSGVLYLLLCTVNWLNVEELNVAAGGLTSDVGWDSPPPRAPLTLTTDRNVLTVQAVAGPGSSDA